MTKLELQQMTKYDKNVWWPKSPNPEKSMGKCLLVSTIAPTKEETAIVE